ncbi:MAG: hypothetical protein IAE83_04840 [Anaerolinea sp.]|nr:hypothetical protein [Anaerolinea sp.]
MYLRRVFPLVMMAAVALLLTGCGGDSAPTATPLPTDTPALPPTLPPTWTPGAAPLFTATSESSPEPTETRTPMPGVPTLPPTWTPFVIPTVTRSSSGVTQFTRVPPTFTPAARATRVPIGGRLPAEGPPTPIPSSTYEAVCDGLVTVNPTDTLIYTGMEAHLSWTPVEGADSYQVWLLNPGLKYSYAEVQVETSVTFVTDLFKGPGLYGWEIVPMRGGVRLCQSLTGVFNVRLRL